MGKTIARTSKNLNHLIHSLSESQCIYRTPKKFQIWHSLYRKVKEARHVEIKNQDADELIANFWNERENSERDDGLYGIDLDNVGYLHAISCQIIQLQHDMTDLFLYSKDLCDLIKWNKAHKPLGMLNV